MDYGKNGYLTKPKLIRMTNELKKQKFGSEKGFKLTDKGRYSIATPIEANKISQIIAKYFKDPDNKTITDATLGMAGNSISFAKYFKQVNAFEIDEVHYETAIHNLQVAKISEEKIMVVHGNYLELYNTVQQDAIYIDAPWGGPNYFKIPKLQLKLGNMDLPDVCNMVRPYTKLIALNLPFNFDFEDLMKRSLHTKICIHVIKEKKQLLAILI